MANENLSAEFDSRYRGTWVRVKQAGKADYDPVIITGVAHIENPTSTKFSVTWENVDGSRGAGNYGDFEWDLTLPKSKVIQPDDTTVIFCGQRADRQWKRGFGWGTFSFWNPIEVLYDELMEVSDMLSIPESSVSLIYALKQQWRGRGEDSLGVIVSMVYSPTYRSFDDCIDFLENKRGLVAAFSEHFFVSVAPDSPDYLLWRDTLPIGRVGRNNRDITCFEGIFTQEVRDFFARQGRNYGHIQ